MTYLTLALYILGCVMSYEVFKEIYKNAPPSDIMDEMNKSEYSEYSDSVLSISIFLTSLIWPFIVLKWLVIKPNFKKD